MKSRNMIRKSKDDAVSEIIGYILVFSLAVVLIGTSILIYVPDSGTANDLNYQASALNSIENLQTSLINSGAQTGTQYYSNIPMGIQSSFFGQNTPTSVSYLTNSNFSYSYTLKLGVQVEGYNSHNSYNKVIDSIGLPGARHPDSVVFDPTNGNLYVATYCGGSERGGEIFEISSSTEQIINTVSLRYNPYSITYDSFSNDIIVSLYDGGQSNRGVLESLSATTLQEVACHIASSRVYKSTDYSYIYYQITYDSDSGNLIVGLGSNNNNVNNVTGMAVYNASTFQLLRIEVPLKCLTEIKNYERNYTNCRISVIPSSIVYDPANGLIYVAGAFNDWAINGITYQCANLYPVPTPFGGNPCPGNNPSPWAIGFDSYNGNIYATSQSVRGNSGIDALIPYGSSYDHFYVFSGTSSTCLESVETPVQPAGLVYDPANREVYVASFLKGNEPGVISVFNGMDPTETTPIQNITVGYGPGAGFNSLAYDSANGNIYVLNFNSTNISVIQGNTQLGKGWKIADGGLPLSYGFNGSGSVAVTGPTSFVKQYTYSLEDGSVLESDTNGNGRNESALPFIFNLTSGYLGFTSNLVNFAGSSNIQMVSDNPTSVTLTLMNFSGMTIHSGEILKIVNTTTGASLNIKVLNIYLCDFSYSFTSPLYKAWDYSFYNTYTASGASFSYVDSLPTWTFRAPALSATVSGDTVTFHTTSEIILYAITLGYYDYNVQITSS